MEIVGLHAELLSMGRRGGRNRCVLYMTFGVESAMYVRADLRTKETFVFVAMFLILFCRVLSFH